MLWHSEEIHWCLRYCIWQMDEWANYVERPFGLISVILMWDASKTSDKIWQVNKYCRAQSHWLHWSDMAYRSFIDTVPPLGRSGIPYMTMKTKSVQYLSGCDQYFHNCMFQLTTWKQSDNVKAVAVTGQLYMTLPCLSCLSFEKCIGLFKYFVVILYI